VGSTPTTRAKYFDYMANNRFVEYVTESYDELMHKVSWPTWSELQNSAVVVSVASLIIALVVFAMDKSFEIILKQFYSLF
jgi:preprotein translocase subunit SecE